MKILKKDIPMGGITSTSSVITILIGMIPIVWLGLLLAPVLSSEGTVFDKLEPIKTALSHPFQIRFGAYSLKTVGIFIAVYLLAIILYKSTRKNYRRGEEHGSAKWGNATMLSKKLCPRRKENGIILTQNVKLSIKGVHKHRKNLNQLIDGGSGSGKTLFYVTPNILQLNSSYVILDPKGETLYRTGRFLEENGYKVKVVNLLEMDKSDGYNPFKYIRPGIHKEEDIQRIVTNIFSAMTPKGSQTQDPFWDQTASMLLKALMLYLYDFAPESEQNFAMINELLRAARIKEDEEDYRSPVDKLFDELREKEPYHTSVQYYDLYRNSAAKTLKSIQITLVAKVERFLIPSLERLTAYDELELDKVGEEKTALFAIIPDNDSSFNFLVSILYTQLFQQLYKVADQNYHGALPLQVQFIMDEFANVALPDNFQTVLATCRSRGIGISIIIQNIAQLKKLFEKDWESVIGNCDTFLYLGGNEQSTHEYVSKLLGKETINTNTYGRSRGRNGSFTTNDQMSGRELLDPAEVRLIPDGEAIVFIKGERPVKDKKFDVFHHPNFKYTALGGGKPYEYIPSEGITAKITVSKYDGEDYIPDSIKNIDISDVNFLDTDE